MPMNKNQRAILLGLSAATFLGPLTQTIYTPSLPEIGTFFRVGPVLVNLTISLHTIILDTGRRQFYRRPHCRHIWQKSDIAARTADLYRRLSYMLFF